MKTLTTPQVIRGLLSNISKWDKDSLIEFVSDNLEDTYSSFETEKLLKEYNDIIADGDPDNENYLVEINDEAGLEEEINAWGPEDCEEVYRFKNDTDATIVVYRINENEYQVNRHFGMADPDGVMRYLTSVDSGMNGMSLKKLLRYLRNDSWKEFEG